MANNVKFKFITATNWTNQLAAGKTPDPNTFYRVEGTGTYDLYLGSELLSNQDEINAALGRIGANEANITALQTLTAGFENKTIKKYIDDAIAGVEAGDLKSKIETAEAAIKTIQETTIPNAIKEAKDHADTEVGKVAADLAETDGKLEALTGRVTTAEGEIDALQAAVGDANAGLVKNVADLQTLTGTHTENIAKNATAIETLNGTGDGSVRKIAADEINTLIGAVSDKDTIDNITELVTYVNENGADLAEVVAKANANEGKIDKVLDGTTTVPKAADAATLGGNAASHFAVASEVSASLANKADKATTYTKDEVNAELAKKADANNVYTKAEADGKLDLKADKSTTYTKDEVDGKLADKANSADVYTKGQVDAELAEKADAATTLAGYGITDAYTKSEVYTKTESDNSATSIAEGKVATLKTDLLGTEGDDADSTAPPTIYSVKAYATKVAAAALSSANSTADTKIATAIDNALAWTSIESL